MKLKIDAPRNIYCYMELGDYSIHTYGYTIVDAIIRAFTGIIEMVIDNIKDA